MNIEFHCYLFYERDQQKARSGSAIVITSTKGIQLSERARAKSEGRSSGYESGLGSELSLRRIARCYI